MSTYQVGPGKPPLHTRFKKGNQEWKKREEKRQANQSRSYIDDFRAVLGAHVPVRRNGRLTYQSRLLVLVNKLVHEAIKGDVGAADTLLNLHADSMTIGDIQKTVLILNQPGDDTD